MSGPVVTVTQADREAAALANSYQHWDAFWHGAGDRYSQSQAKAFARHRTQAEAASKAREDALVEALEEAREWLSGWGSAEPYIATIDAALAKAGQP